MTIPHAKLLLVFGVLAVGAFTLMLPTPAQDSPKADPPKPASGTANTDSHGDPLPDKAVTLTGSDTANAPGRRLMDQYATGSQ